ncbi:exported hypothetical protein [uncultured Pleomorphomonas sp.]|uniref:Uncharacterized protein n=1 Tax=uncultured Pleomorphomonas sp. TaxID=442121 RepID=A0A212LR49_9HYPH|nr:hypothetical protein [uncultured Pleomorphomonas sp.]SCM79920.1 exported hypothetical protein [uncultured Pleomorphomonas sp.]
MRLPALAASAAFLALAATVPAHADSFTLATIYEDAFFEGAPLSIDNAAAIVATGMPERACVQASRLANTYGGFTACIPVPDGMTPECARAQAAPTDSNLESCYGPALLAGMRDESER